MKSHYDLDRIRSQRLTTFGILTLVVAALVFLPLLAIGLVAGGWSLPGTGFALATSPLAAVASTPVMKEYAQGAAQSMLSPVADFLAPTVDVPLSTMKYKTYTEKNRFRLPDTRRTIGGRATTLAFDADDTTFNCAPHALDFPVDLLEQLESGPMEDLLMEGAQMCAEVAALSHEKTVIDAALAAVGAGTDSNFTSTSVDPVDVIDGKILDVIKAARYGGLMGVGVLFGATAWKRFKNNSAVRARVFMGQKNPAQSVSDQQASALLLGNPEVKTSYMVYDSAAEGVAASMSFVLDTGVLIFARHPSPTRRDPSFMKTFRLRGRYMVPGTYSRDDGRVEVAKYDWSEYVAVTNSAAAARINATDS